MIIIRSLPGGSDSVHCGHEAIAFVPPGDWGGPVPGAQVNLATPSAAPSPSPHPDLATQDLPDWFGGGHVTQAGPRDPSKHDVCHLLGACHCSQQVCA